MRNLYLNPKKNTDDELCRRGTPVFALILDVVKTKQGYVVVCSPKTGSPYSEKVFKSKPIREIPKVRIGGEVIVYVDEIDCDGEYYVDLS